MKPQIVMTINEVRYVEKKPNANRKSDCEQCAFGFDRVGCYIAVTEAGAATFGGDCMQRNVIYAKEPTHV